jgi:hypothetical protein
MADKRISQLIERVDIANNDVLPIVASGATTTNKVTISTLQDWMQENIDLGVTSVGITLGTSGTDVNVTGSPITSSGNITINIPDASTSARGVVTTGSQNFAGNKSFQNTIFANAGLRLDQNGTALPTFVQNISGSGLISTGSNGLGFNSANNLYFSGSEKGGAVLAVNNTAVRTYTLQDANGTLAFTSELDGYVTLDTAQIITAQKTFNTSGGSDTMIISHGSGSGIALDVIKAGNSEAIRVTKTSGSGNAMTISGGNFEAGTIVKTGGTSSQFLMADGSVNTSVLPSGDYVTLATSQSITGLKTFTNSIILKNSPSLPGFILSSYSANALEIGATISGTTYYSSIVFPAGAQSWNLPNASGTIALTTDLGAYLPLAGGTLTGALNGTSASFTGGINAIGQEKAFSWQRTAGTDSDVYSLNADSSRAYLQNDTTSNILMSWLEGGNIGIGTVTPQAQLDISTDVSATGAILRLSNQSNSILADQPHGTIQFFSGDNSTPADSVVSSIISAQATTSPNEAYLSFLTGNNTEKMRITSAGSVGIGTDSPQGGGGATDRTLSINSGSGAASFVTCLVGDVKYSTLFTSSSQVTLETNAAIPLTFSTNNTERMRITSGGAVEVGIATAGVNVNFNINGAANKAGRIQFMESGSPIWLVGNGAASENGRFEIYDNINGTGVQLLRGATSWTTLSDERFKDIIEPISVNDKLKNIRAVVGKYKTDKEGIRRNFLIAQDLLEVFPEVVDVDEDEEKPMGVRYQELIPILIKAIQELKTEIDSLKNQINK